ncbi:hypothetical protein [Roseococcus pinisoli]|uniref:Uncharacterized protein n=1 Tax=Roseococcus pinisoli TaxID=2835040 RepID=A0ABS5Q7Z2_9PROT|nr:hypothetical protein [Roseococcus pinisoli]MBS7809789.1 hypothetical protein [Roseococcus pinisoli]
MRWTILLAALLLALPAAAQHRPATVTLEGRLQAGAEERAARFEFQCSANGPNATGVLSVELHVPHFAELERVFDFDPFEGPDARAGARSRLEVGQVSAQFEVAGWIGVTEDRPFAFGLGVPRRRDARRLGELSRVLRPLTAGPATLTWTQRPAGQGTTPLVARLEVGAADAARLRTLLAPCLVP